MKIFTLLFLFSSTSFFSLNSKAITLKSKTCQVELGTLIYDNQEYFFDQRDERELVALGYEVVAENGEYVLNGRATCSEGLVSNGFFSVVKATCTSNVTLTRLKDNKRLGAASNIKESYGHRSIDTAPAIAQLPECTKSK